MASLTPSGVGSKSMRPVAAKAFKVLSTYHYKLPVLTGEILIRRFDCRTKSTLATILQALLFAELQGKPAGGRKVCLTHRRHRRKRSAARETC
jgi:hypothetical protein